MAFIPYIKFYSEAQLIFACIVSEFEMKNWGSINLDKMLYAFGKEYDQFEGMKAVFILLQEGKLKHLISLEGEDCLLIKLKPFIPYVTGVDNDRVEQLDRIADMIISEYQGYETT